MGAEANRQINTIATGISKVKILDRKDFDHDLYTNYQETISYLQAKLNTEFIITGTGRDEVLEFPTDALREALVNAIAHRDYRSTANIQVHIFQDRVEIISPGGLPAGMQPEDLGHKSIPKNPLLFSMLYRMDLVEQIGSGITRILQLCTDLGSPSPELITETNWFTVAFKRRQVTGQVTKEILKLLQACTEEMSRNKLQDKLKLKHIDNFTDNYLRPAINANLIEMTIPEKPKSRLQKYRQTAKGKQYLEHIKG